MKKIAFQFYKFKNIHILINDNIYMSILLSYYPATQNIMKFEKYYKITADWFVSIYTSKNMWWYLFTFWINNN